MTPGVGERFVWENLGIVGTIVDCACPECRFWGRDGYYSFRPDDPAEAFDDDVCSLYVVLPEDLRAYYDPHSPL